MIRVCHRSKRQWKMEWKPLIQKARKYTKAQKRLHAEIRKSKAEMWKQYVKEGTNV